MQPHRRAPAARAGSAGDSVRGLGQAEEQEHRLRASAATASDDVGNRDDNDSHGDGDEDDQTDGDEEWGHEGMEEDAHRTYQSAGDTAAATGAAADSPQQPSKRARPERESADAQQPQEEDVPVLRFRSYQPQSADLRGGVLDQPPLPEIERDVADIVASKDAPLVVGEVVRRPARCSCACRAEDPADALMRGRPQDLAALAPRRPNWDLERHLAPAMRRLKRGTQAAIAQLVRARLAQTAGLVGDAAAPTAASSSSPAAVTTTTVAVTSTTTTTTATGDGDDAIALTVTTGRTGDDGAEARVR